MFKDLNWLSVESRVKYNKAVFTYRVLNNMAPEYITNRQTPMSETHSLNLRSCENGTLNTPMAHTSLYKGSFACSAPQLPASVAQLDAPSDWRPGGRGFNSRRGRQHSFVEIDHEIFSTVILSLPLIQEGQLSVSEERMCTILVNRLED